MIIILMKNHGNFYKLTMIFNPKFVVSLAPSTLLELDINKLKLCGSLKIIHKQYTEQIDLMELHFSYCPGAEGFNEAKKDY